MLSKSEDLPEPSILAEGILKQIELTIMKEEANSKQDESSYLACFKKKNFRRTRIACIVWMLQNMTGSALMSLSAYFFEQAGMSPSLSFTFSIIQYALGLLGTLSSWFTSQWFGRYTLLFTGFCIQTVILLIVGGLSFHLSTSVSWGIGSLLVIYTFVYDCTSGPLTYCLVTELPSALLRTKTVILSRVMYNLVGLVNGVLTARMLNPSSWNWGAKTGLFYGAFALFAVIWSYFELPETKGRTSAELDILFEDGVFARKFKSTEVEVFNVDQLMNDIGEDGVKNLVINNERKNSDEDEKALYLN